MDSADSTPKLKTARTLHDENVALREENARLQAAVDYAFNCATNEEIADVETLNDLVEG